MHCRILLLTVASLGAALFSSSAVTPLTTSSWSSNNPAVKVAERNGMVEISYALKPGETFQLIPKEPILLPADATRVALWLAPMLGHARLSFQLEDAAGRMFNAPVTRTSEIDSNLVASDGSQKQFWATWSALESTNLRIPGEEEIKARLPAPESSEVIASMLRPPFRIKALRFTVSETQNVWMGGFGRDSAQAVREGRGNLLFKDLRAFTRDSREADFVALLVQGNRQSRDEPARIFLDESTIGQAGPRELEVIVRKEYQGAPVWVARREFEYDPNNAETLFSNAIELPKLPPGSYTIETRSRIPRKLLMGHRMRQLIVGEGPETAELASAAPLRWEWQSGKPNHVFEAGTTEAVLQLKAGAFDKKDYPENAGVVLALLDGMGKELRVEEPRPLGDAEFKATVEDGRDYYARAEIRVGDRLLDTVLLHFGVANSSLPDGRKPPEGLPTMDEFLSGKAHLHPELRISNMRSPTYPFVSTYDPQSFAEFATQAGELKAQSASLKAGWRDIEPLPGVYRWDILEEQLRMLNENGMKAIWGYTPYGGSPAIPPHIPLMIPRDNFGDFASAREMMFGASPNFRPQQDGFVRFWKALADRFVDHPGVLGYRVYTRPFRAGPNPENFTLHYSEADDEAFREWNGGKDERITPMLTIPGMRLPDLPPDLSTGWQRFMDFATHMQASANEETIAGLRVIDPERIIMVDMKHSPFAAETWAPMFKENNVTYKNEGAPHFREGFMRSMVRQKGLRLLDELHRHMPSSRSIADTTDFWGSHLSDTSFWLLRWRPSDHDPENPYHLAPDAAEIYPWLAATRPAWNEYLSAKSEEPEVLVFGSRTAMVLGGPRRGEFKSIEGSNEFDALFERHQVLAHAASEFTPWVDLEKFKLVFLCGETLTPEHESRVEQFATQGGRVVFVGNAGRFSSDDPTVRDQLRKKIGHLPNVRSIAAPQTVAGMDGEAWYAATEFPKEELEEILAWAGVQRRAEVAGGKPAPFQVLLREKSPEELFVGILRGWPGWYRNNIEFEDQLLKKFGEVGGRLTVRDLKPGEWTIQEIHRETRDLGTATVGADGVLSLDSPPSRAGEVRLLKLTWNKAAESGESSTE
jgi:hypothetical protein